MTNSKIIATIGPVSENEEMLINLLKEGVDVVRYNFSHEKPEKHIERLNRVRKVSQSLGLYVGAMLDTKGPEIRTHTFKDGKKVEIKQGSTITIVTTHEIIGDETTFSVTYSGLFDDIDIGGTILVDDGYLQLTVIKKNEENKEIMAVANNTHSIRDRRGINVPNTVLKMPFISPKDYADICVACDNDFDYIAASFTRRASDVRAIREILKDKQKENIKIIAKVENQEALDNLDEIIEEADGVMVARGDLGVEVLAEELPHVQKDMTQKCQRSGKIVIVATQMLESMQENPRPTRAEVSDIANAIYEGADATMLSGESAVGKYPVEAVSYMNRVQRRTEMDIDYSIFADEAFKYSSNEINEILAYSAARSAKKEEVKAIVAYGKDIAEVISKYRPNVPIFAYLNDLCEARRLSIYFGVFPVLSGSELDKKIKNLNLEKGDTIITVRNSKLEAHKQEK
ncbi:pyruvate kinase [Acholeplasma sp. OttesenSCG-928-E16]|nr:pyruvate kinase [Acholeplasma sp. OttesenSCG-928-E16]